MHCSVRPSTYMYCSVTSQTQTNILSYTEIKPLYKLIPSYIFKDKTPQLLLSMDNFNCHTECLSPRSKLTILAGRSKDCCKMKPFIPVEIPANAQCHVILLKVNMQSSRITGCVDFHPIVLRALSCGEVCGKEHFNCLQDEYCGSCGPEDKKCDQFALNYNTKAI